MKKLLLLLIPLLLYGCPYGYKYNTGTLPDIPTNMEAINSEYDDYNISAPFIRDVFPLVFSSNRVSQGTQMDLTYKLMALDFSKETGELQFYNETDNNLDVTIEHNAVPYLLNQVNSSGNEYGPYILSFWFNIMNTLPGYSYKEGDDDDFVLLYATDQDGNLDIHYIHNRNETLTLAPLASVNTGHNEAYPCFTDDFSILYFCSDQQGDFDIFSVPWNNSILLEESLANKDLKTRTPSETLNSSADDKCPFIDENILVFTSNRPGGYGGYDLYYSQWINEQWTTPVNLGEKINTAWDEYRPVIRLQTEFESHLLLFSSNRPGGKGGFDLYYTGVELD
jgi:hypothetical protein